MSVAERLVDPPRHWPSAETLLREVAGGALLILPEEIAEPRGTLTAFFRVDAQELRVRAEEAGMDARLLAPGGADLAGFSEFAADWVLPVLVASVLTVPSTVAAEMIYDHINKSRGEAASRVVLYREAVISDGRVRLRELEGPAEEVARLLRERSVEGAGVATSRDELPRLTTHPHDGSR